MKNIIFIVILLLASVAAFAQEKPLTQTEYVKMLYTLEKAPATRSEVIDALRRRGIAFVLTDGVRGLTRSKGRNDEELKRALEEAERRRQDPSVTLLPTPTQSAELIESVRHNTLAAAEEMPDFVVKQLISRSLAYAGTGNWKPKDNLTIAVSYSDKKGEQYKVLAINGAPVDAEQGSNYAGLGGATTGGEFVEDLKRIFKVETRTEFKPVETDVIRGRAAVVFEYSIKLENNKGTGLGYKAANYESVPAGEFGKVWVDRTEHRVLRIEAHSTEIPPSFPIKAFQSTNDYDWVTIADVKYLLPVSADIRFTSTSSIGLLQSRNVIRFRSYQKYGTEVKAVGDDEDVPPEKP